jgi:hypothetical protein
MAVPSVDPAIWAATMGISSTWAGTGAGAPGFFPP